MLKKILAISAFCILMLSSTANARVWYADIENGNDSNVGSTYTAPFKTIEKAFSRAQAGDTIIVNPGVYYGPFNFTAKGTSSAHIAIKAKDKGEGKTILTNANQTIRENASGNLWTKYNESTNTWVTDYTISHDSNAADTSFYPTRLLCDDVDMLQFESVQALEDGVYGTQTALNYGYYYDDANHKLYIRLRTDGKYGSANPNQHTIKVSPSVYNRITLFYGDSEHGDVIGNDSYNLCIGAYGSSAATSGAAADSYYVDIEGFTFETPGNTGILLRASDVTVKNCWFRGCRTGIRGAARSEADKIYSENITIENCDYSQYPIFDDTREIINTLGQEGGFSWWLRKGTKEFSKVFNYERGGIVTYMGEDWAIRKNKIHDCFDGISCMAMLKYKNNSAEVPAENIEISGNIFENCVDNAIELENHGKNIEIFDNDFENNFIPLSYQPLNKTPWPTNIRIYKNVIHNTRDFNDLFSVTAGKKTAVFKIGIEVTESNGFESEPEEFVITEDGVKVFNNTIVFPGSRFFENVSGSGKSKIPFRNFEFTNNVIVCAANSISDFGFGMTRAQILYREDTGIVFSHNVFSLDRLKRVSQFADNLLTDGEYVYDANTIGFNELSRLSVDPTIKADSVLIGAGTTDVEVPEMSSTVGALGYGQSFHNYVVGVNN